MNSILKRLAVSVALVSMAVAPGAWASSAEPEASLEVTLVDVTRAKAPVTLGTLVVPIQVVDRLPDVTNDEEITSSYANELLVKQGKKVPYTVSVWKDEKGGSGSESGETYVGMVGEAFYTGPQKVRLNLVNATLERMDVLPLEGTNLSLELPRRSQQLLSQVVKFEPGKEMVLNSGSADRQLEYRLRYKPAAL